MSREIAVDTPIGMIRAYTADDPEYPEIYIYVGEAQFVRVGYNGEGIYSEDSGEQENIIVDVWTDGGDNDPEETFVFGKSEVERLQ